MKRDYFLYYFLVFVFLFSYSNSMSIDLINDFKERKNDIDFYYKVKNIKRDIIFNDSKRTLDVYYRKNEEISELKPVVIYVYGGAWITGDNIKFTKIGSFLEKNDYIGVIPNYILFPHGSLEDMVNDIYTAINWTYDNIEKFGGNPKRITVVAHSAGAHLVALTLFKSYNSMLNNEKVLLPLPELEKIILLSGPYDFDDYSTVKKYFDKNINNSFVEQLIKIIFKSKNVSPYDIIKSMESNSVNDGFKVKKFIIYQASEDKQIPRSSGEKLITQMKRVSNNVNILYVYKEGYSHVEITSGIRNDRKEPTDYFYTLLNL